MRFVAALVLLPLLLAATLASAETAATATTSKAASTAAPAAAPADEAITPVDPDAMTYLVARIKLTGTDLTQVVFFRHAAITTMEACEEERNAGLTTGWNHYSRYYLKTLKGISYKVEYLCVQGEQRMASWQRGVPTDHFYLVRTRDKKLQVTRHANFFACRTALRAITREEDMDTFCAISSQAIMKTPPPESAASATPALP